MEGGSQQEKCMWNQKNKINRQFWKTGNKLNNIGDTTGKYDFFLQTWLLTHNLCGNVLKQSPANGGGRGRNPLHQNYLYVMVAVPKKG